MTQTLSDKPVVICFSGLDPTGGAGIQADIETLASLGCHATPIITSLTVQDTHNVHDVTPVESTMIIAQARAILEDMPVKCIKIGLLGSIGIIEALHTLIQDYPHLPVIFDPIQRAGGGTVLANAKMLNAIETLLLPHVELITPNRSEAHILAGQADSIDACANELMAKGCSHVLITDTDNQPETLTNKLWGHGRALASNEWPRCEGTYHGSGCTLTAASAAYLAHGTEVINAVRQAQSFTWQSIKHGQRLGMGQLIPQRLFWCNQEQQSQWHQAN